MVRFFSGTFTAGFIKCFQQRAYDDSLFLRGTIWVCFALSQSWSGTVSYCLVFFFQFIRKYLLADDLRRRREYKGKKRNNIMSISLEKNDFESPSTAWNKLIDSNIAISLFYTLFDRLIDEWWSYYWLLLSEPHVEPNKWFKPEISIFQKNLSTLNYLNTISIKRSGGPLIVIIDVKASLKNTSTKTWIIYTWPAMCRSTPTQLNLNSLSKIVMVLKASKSGHCNQLERRLITL